jgi:uncharacterized LabA/DUF88 family protein
MNQIRFAEGGKEKAGVYIDGSNLYHGAKEEGWQIDYQKMKDFIGRRYDITVFSYYDSIGYQKETDGRYMKDSNGEYIPDPKALKFLQNLKGQGARLVTKKLKFINGNENKASNKMDGDLIVDALSEQASWDVLILMSGDCDLESLVKRIATLKKAHIFSFKANMSWELKQLAFDSPNITYTKLNDIKSSISRES